MPLTPTYPTPGLPGTREEEIKKLLEQYRQHQQQLGESASLKATQLAQQMLQPKDTTQDLTRQKAAAEAANLGNLAATLHESLGVASGLGPGVAKPVRTMADKLGAQYEASKPEKPNLIQMLLLKDLLGKEAAAQKGIAGAYGKEADLLARYKQRGQQKDPDKLTAYQKAQLELQKQRLGQQKELAKERMKPKTQKQDKKKPPKMVTAAVVAQLGDFKAAGAQLKEVGSAWKEKAGEWYSGITQLSPRSESTEYNDLKKVAAQTIGRILEGGKLTDADVQRYADMLPSPWDSEERAKQKIDNIQKLLTTQRKARIQTLGAAGYDVEELEKLYQQLEGEKPEAPQAPAVKLKENETIRGVKGRKAIFDKNTKQFLRWHDGR